MRVEMGRTLNFLGTESHKRDMDYHWGMGACRWFGTRSFIVRSTGAENLPVATGFGARTRFTTGAEPEI